jgi:hypothetical protein
MFIAKIIIQQNYHIIVHMNDNLKSLKGKK